MKKAMAFAMASDDPTIPHPIFVNLKSFKLANKEEFDALIKHEMWHHILNHLKRSLSRKKEEKQVYDKLSGRERLLWDSLSFKIDCSIKNDAKTLRKIQQLERLREEVKILENKMGNRI